MLLTIYYKNRERSPLIGPDLSSLQYTEVSFPSGGITLSGMLFLPEGKGPFPAVVMIHGSGASQRNNPWYLTVVERLQDAGVAVLLPDKRGSVKSEGDWTKASFQDLAGDAAAAMDYLRFQPVFPCASIGVMGFSQGGWIVPMVAAENGNVDFAVVMSGAAVTTDEQLLYEEASNVADFVFFRFLAQPIAPLAAESVRRTDFWRLIAGFDPIPYWRKVDIPAFLAFGENDRIIPVEESVGRIQALGKSNLTAKVYPGGGHGITDLATQRVQEAFLSDLVDFIRGIQPPSQ